MTCNYRPYTKEDKLEVGTRFDLAGAKGEIIDIDETPNNWPHNVWLESDPDADNLKLDLTKFPGLLIEDKPLTIDKRVKEDVFSLIESITVDIAVKCGGDTWESVDELNRYLNSLEEV